MIGVWEGDSCFLGVGRFDFDVGRLPGGGDFRRGEVGQRFPFPLSLSPSLIGFADCGDGTDVFDDVGGGKEG